MVKTRLNYIANIRILCTLLVIFGHSYPFDVDIPSTLINIRTIVYVFHMPLFVLISGYLTVFHKSVEKYGSFSYLKSRIWKLMIPYLVLTVVFYIPKSFLDSSTQLSINAFLKSVFIPRANVWGHFWFLPMLAVFTVISVFIYKLMKKEKNLVVILCVISYFLLFLPKITDCFALNDIKNNLCWYLTGMLLGDIKLEKQSNSCKSIVLTIVCLAVLISLYFLPCAGYLKTLIKIFITVFVCYGLYMLLYNCDMCKYKFFNFINKYSFSLFILSWPFQSIIEIVFNKVLKQPVIPTMIFMFSGGIILPIITIKIYKYISNKLQKSKLNFVLNKIGIVIGLN